MKKFFKKSYLTFLLLLSTSACGGAGTESVNPPGPVEAVGISSPCYDIVVNLPVGWELERFGPDSEEEPPNNVPEVPTAYVARLTEAGLSTDIRFVYAILDTQAMSFEDYVFSFVSEDTPKELIEFAEEEGVVGAGLKGENSEDPGSVTFIYFTGVPQSEGSSILEIFWFIGVIEGDPASTDQERLDSAKSKFEQFVYLFETLEIKTVSCDFNTP